MFDISEKEIVKYAKESLVQGLDFCSAYNIFLLSDSAIQRRMGVGRQEVM